MQFNTYWGNKYQGQTVEVMFLEVNVEEMSLLNLFFNAQLCH